MALASLLNFAHVLLEKCGSVILFISQVWVSVRSGLCIALLCVCVCVNVCVDVGGGGGGL